MNTSISPGTTTPLYAFEECLRAALNWSPSDSTSAFDHWLAQGYPTEFDVVFSGGAYRGAWFSAGIKLLNTWQNAKLVTVRRISGTSAGAWMGILLCMGSETIGIDDILIEVEAYRKKGYHRPDAFAVVFDCLFGSTLYEKCNDRLHIHACAVTSRGRVDTIFSQFSSNRMLFDAAMASGHIPFFTRPTLFHTIDGTCYIDGVVVRRLAYFRDLRHPQLLVKSLWIPYPLRFLAWHDPDILAFSTRGKLMLLRWICGSPNPYVQWHSTPTHGRRRLSLWRCIQCAIGILLMYRFRLYIRENVLTAWMHWVLAI